MGGLELCGGLCYKYQHRLRLDSEPIFGTLVGLDLDVEQCECTIMLISMPVWTLVSV